MSERQLIIDSFERIMLPVRALGWRVALYRESAARSRIEAVHPVYPPQNYFKVVFTQEQVVSVYERWFSSCAALLTQVATASST